MSSFLAASRAAVSRTGADAGAGGTTAGPRHSRRASSGQYGSESTAAASTIAAAIRPVRKAPTNPSPRRTGTTGGGGEEGGVSLMVSGPCTLGRGRRSISSSTAWRVGCAAGIVVLNGKAASGWAAAGLMATADTMRQASARPAALTRRTNSAEARGEKKVAASSARACKAARAESGSASASRAS